MQDTTKDTWQENVLDQPLVLVYFWAAWCRPCKMQAPVLEQLEQDIATLSIAKVDADANLGLVEELAISSIPTLILYKNGEHVWTKTGAKPRGVLIEDIAPFV